MSGDPFCSVEWNWTTKSVELSSSEFSTLEILRSMPNTALEKFLFEDAQLHKHLYSKESA